MNHLKDFSLFEATRYDELMGKLLHVYGSIPLPKEKSSIVISKIVRSSENENKPIGEFFNLGEDVNINHAKPHDKVRFKDYFDSFLHGKDTRGFNFEGLIAGLFGGKLAPRGFKYDLTINNKRYSVKFVDSEGKAPEIGSYITLKDTDIGDFIIEEGGLSRLFQGENYELMEEAWKKISRGIDGWILAYPDNSLNPKNIVLNIISKDSMYDILSDGLSTSPKGGYTKLFSLALSSKYRHFKEEYNINRSYINIPELSFSELKKLSKTDDEMTWGKTVFGVHGSKIRPDVLRHIRNNRLEIGKKLLDTP